MFFKSLELTGFKSFVDHTKISFGKGITSIVGPNGCGKSNISDAIRWVLGEQRAKMLRGAKMEDFIFSGSASRKQAGMAEVSITISDVAGKISIPELAEFNEITVTRRLYRSGESEYLINKTQCRLKDVVDLFLDTGISTRAFSIIEQDQVQRIVTSKPEERRFIIEEAAGIMKYKHRKHAAMNKLTAAKTNLERVTDIINELERQRNSLKRQANKAERYKQYKDEMDQLFLATASDEWKRLNSLQATIEEEIKRLEEVRVSLETDISTRKNNLISIQSTIDENSRELASVKEEEFKITSMVENSEGKIALFTSQIEESSTRVKRLEADIAEMNARSKEMSASLEEKDKNRTELLNEVSDKTAKLEAKKNSLNSGQSGMEEINSQIDSKETEIAELNSQLSQKGNDLASDRTRIEILEGRRKKTLGEKEETEKHLADLTLKKSEKLKNEAEVRARFEQLQSENSELTEKLQKLAGDKKEKENQVIDQKTKVTEIGARLESITEVDRSLEGYQDGIKSLLQLGEDNSDIRSKLHGTLLEKVKVDKRFETALEVLLGNKLQALLISKPEDSVEAIELLHKNRLGRSTFLPVEFLDDRKIADIPKGNGVIGHATELIETEPNLRPLLKRLLFDVVFVEDIQTAIRLRANNDLTFVTARGDVVDRFGVISGGTSGNASEGILERKRAIEELSKSLADNKAMTETLVSELEKVTAELAESESRKEQKEKLLKDEELNLVHEKRDVEAIDLEMRRQSEKINTFQNEIESLDNEKRRLESDISNLSGEIANLTDRKSAIAAELAELQKTEKESRGTIAGLAELISNMEIELTSLKGDLNMLTSEKNRLETGISDLTSRIAAMQGEIESANAKKSKLLEEIELAKEAIHNGLAKKDSLTGKLTELNETLENARGQIGDKEDHLKRSHDSLDLTKDTLSEARIKNSETTVKISSLSEKIEEHNFNIDTVKTFDLSGFNIEECRERYAELRDSMSKIGDVNLSAIEDYNQVMERLTFLTTQRDDLTQSIDDISKVIDKLNRTSRKLFQDTFEQVRANFQVVFKRLFNGGEADMILMDESNMLETGIDIIIRPPGKKRQNITLLSAGEKAMTAVSVLFSVFMVMPSPFCLLDEVDAPLDESNIQRFKDILRDFAETTQFMVITHNQKTMAFADRLYGITMQQPGISQVLSVDMVETDMVLPDELKTA
ncbi:MAG: chromosome segregation protein SMC [Nitrospinota bacterium]|nr:chromosome segregation protein SMC [Nitrospinota bacterium]